MQDKNENNMGIVEIPGDDRGKLNDERANTFYFNR